MSDLIDATKGYKTLQGVDDNDTTNDSSTNHSKKVTPELKKVISPTAENLKILQLNQSVIEAFTCKGCGKRKHQNGT